MLSVQGRFVRLGSRQRAHAAIRSMANRENPRMSAPLDKAKRYLLASEVSPYDLPPAEAEATGFGARIVTALAVGLAVLLVTAVTVLMGMS